MKQKLKLKNNQINIGSWGLTAISSVLAVSFTVPQAQAITINLNFVDVGQTFPITSGDIGVSAPTTVYGGGNINDLVHAAADYWESALLDNHTYNIDFGWADLSGPLGIASQWVVSKPGNGGTIRFDGTRTDWFMDSTPYDSSEYHNYTESSADLGGGTVNTGRIYNADFFQDSSLFYSYDFLSVAIHEMGHLLGVADFDNFGDPLVINNPLPYAGTSIDTTGGHININTTSMYPSIFNGRRKLLSEVDILAAAEVNGFTNVNLNPTLESVPEPSIMLGSVIALGLAGLIKKNHSFEEH